MLSFNNFTSENNDKGFLLVEISFKYNELLELFKKIKKDEKSC